ncbi:substrate-binding domain-containing protein [Vaginisenegalia massiliensis]|uniref:substrate-binding domain-containing protein n=1 Tax=Vaginisenegalia massiliensis TaxID=2058294 RepID=UPI000F5473C2|nr:extracellular solute-binding protein [Vaginisenegalia massiliensis]
MFKQLLKVLAIFGFLVSLGFIIGACSDGEENQVAKADFVADFGGEKLKVLAGSEIKILEPILKDYAKQQKQTIEVTYMGSVDMMRLLQTGKMDYDAVWPASSMWLTLGDKNHILKHQASITMTPVVFGIKQSKAEKLGFTKQAPSIRDILQAVKDKKMTFAMTSATQSNSGASAYLSFLTALSGQKVLTPTILADSTIQKDIQSLLAGVNRTSGSSNWLVDLFLKGDYDAMVNYETLIIQTNHELKKAGKEPLYMVYPKEGIVMSDSPLAYVDHQKEKKEKAFLAFQKYLLADRAQDAIEKTGRRSVYNTVRPANKSAFPKEWGLDTDRVLNTMRLPEAKTIEQALGLYQTSFKKPALTYYVLDYSGSMAGEPVDQLTNALSYVMLPDKAKQYLLQGHPQDITRTYAFNSEVETMPQAKGNGQEMVDLYEKVKEKEPTGGTAMNTALLEVFKQIQQDQALFATHTPMIVILSDGRANDYDQEEAVAKEYQAMNLDVPIFSIQFGDADETYIKHLAELSNGRVFDGRKDLVGAFKSVKGYN